MSWLRKTLFSCFDRSALFRSLSCEHVHILGDAIYSIPYKLKVFSISFRSVPFFILWTFLEMQFIPFHTSCKFSPFRSAPFRSLSCEHSWRCNLFHSIQVVTFHRSVTVRSVLSCRQCHGWGKLCFLVLTVPLRSVLYPVNMFTG